MASKPEQEPSIEEILASIRQIISDDDQPRDAALDATPEEKFESPVPQSAPAQEQPKASFADVLELTNEIPDESALDLSAPEEDEHEPMDIGYAETPKFSIPTEEPVKATLPPKPVESFAAPSSADSIFSNTAAEATSAAFSRLLGNIPVERDETRNSHPGGITIEDIVRDLLTPMLRDWVNVNVPAIVERLVEKELEKLARQARDH